MKARNFKTKMYFREEEECLTGGYNPSLGHGTHVVIRVGEEEFASRDDNEGTLHVPFSLQSNPEVIEVKVPSGRLRGRVAKVDSASVICGDNHYYVVHLIDCEWEGKFHGLVGGLSSLCLWSIEWTYRAEVVSSTWMQNEQPIPVSYYLAARDARDRTGNEEDARKVLKFLSSF